MKCENPFKIIFDAPQCIDNIKRGGSGAGHRTPDTRVTTVAELMRAIFWPSLVLLFHLVSSIFGCFFLRGQRSRQDTPTPFPVNANAFRLAWGRLRKRADLCDLRFHDLRHEAISRFFEMGLSVPEVAVISGHKDARMLFRYTHLRAEDLVNKIG